MELSWCVLVLGEPDDCESSQRLIFVLRIG